MLLSGKIDKKPVITHYFDLQDYDKAFQMVESAKTGKVVFKI